MLFLLPRLSGTPRIFVPGKAIIAKPRSLIVRWGMKITTKTGGKKQQLKFLGTVFPGGMNVPTTLAEPFSSLDGAPGKKEAGYGVRLRLSYAFIVWKHSATFV